jgi:hypothetical protein
MNKFKEYFPSLKDLQFDLTEKYYTLGWAVRCKDVQKFCIDKQKVREAIEKLTNQIIKENGIDDTTSRISFRVLSLLKKELELDEGK